MFSFRPSEADEETIIFFKFEVSVSPETKDEPMELAELAALEEDCRAASGLAGATLVLVGVFVIKTLGFLADSGSLSPVSLPFRPAVTAFKLEAAGSTGLALASAIW